MFNCVKIDANSYETWMLWTGRIGSILCMIVTVALFCHVARDYLRIFHYQHDKPTNKLKKSSPQKLGFILVLIYIISGFISQISNTFIRSNALTITEIPSYTLTQCKSGYLISWIFGGLSASTLYLMFLYRIWIAFHGSVYQYKPWILRIFAILIIVQFIVIISDRFIRVFSDTTWDLFFDKKSGLGYCFADASQDGILIFTYFIALSYFVINIGLLYMFAAGLRKLKREMTELFMAEIQEIRSQRTASIGSKSHSPESPPEKSKSNTENGKDDEHHNDMIELETQKNGNEKNKGTGQHANECEIITKLHNLIKKQTILAFIAILSAFTWLILGEFDRYVIQQSAWILMINIVCSWMMLITSEKYYIICTKYGICKCCYC